MAIAIPKYTGAQPVKPQASKNGTASIDIMDPGYTPANAGLKVASNVNVQSKGGRPTQKRSTSDGMMMCNAKN